MPVHRAAVEGTYWRNCFAIGSVCVGERERDSRGEKDGGESSGHWSGLISTLPRTLLLLSRPLNSCVHFCPPKPHTHESKVLRRRRRRRRASLSSLRMELSTGKSFSRSCLSRRRCNRRPPKGLFHKENSRISHPTAFQSKGHA